MPKSPQEGLEGVLPSLSVVAAVSQFQTGDPQWHFTY